MIKPFIQTKNVMFRRGRLYVKVQGKEHSIFVLEHLYVQRNWFLSYFEKEIKEKAKKEDISESDLITEIDHLYLTHYTLGLCYDKEAIDYIDF
jgi:hypothetical protein